MLRTIILFLVAAWLAAACSDTNETPDVISQDFNLESLPWVEDHSEFTVSLYDTKGDLIKEAGEVQPGNEYEVVFKTNRPVAMHVNKSFGFEFLSGSEKEMTISNTHKYRVLKTNPGFKQVIFEVYPVYYVDGELTHERPQLFVFPEN